MGLSLDVLCSSCPASVCRGDLPSRSTAALGSMWIVEHLQKSRVLHLRSRVKRLGLACLYQKGISHSYSESVLPVSMESHPTPSGAVRLRGLRVGLLVYLLKTTLSEEPADSLTFQQCSFSQWECQPGRNWFGASWMSLLPV